ncbi:MAG TPA: 3,4-dihydroxy-2-butanone-4-phosphate synthase [Bryobacterales bacterium]|jgi:3,4-dihydroxy 2-butanone 4-phosphate synthase/GTP cyclohydrolase II|nr:3,4-dihydroxy-2-butanone-4-phosphate synthase [Bryobacterales bacterium]
MSFASVPEALEEMRAGRMIVVVDDEDRENEGDLTIAAEKVTPEVINFMARYGRGLICLALTEERLDYLRLPLIAEQNTSLYGTAFCQSFDARQGVTTGISAADRARSIHVAIDPATTAADLARPGHIFPLRARKGGVLVRAGQTEASVDLARMAGLIPAGVICEIMNDDGSMARVPQLMEFCARHGMKMLTVAELIRYRLQYERFLHRIAEGSVETPYGEFHTIAYQSDLDTEVHVALVRGHVEDDESVLVRVHSHCLLGDVFLSAACGCHELIEQSLARIAAEGRGVLLYLHATGAGFNLETLPSGEKRLVSHSREYYHYLGEAGQRRQQYESGVGAQILSDLKLRTIRLLTNHPRKIVALEGFGIRIVDQVPVTPPAEQEREMAARRPDHS